MVDKHKAKVEVHVGEVEEILCGGLFVLLQL